MNICHAHSEADDGLEHLQRHCGLPLTIAIESCTRDASIALARGNEILHYIPLDRQRRTAATIGVSLSELLEEARCDKGSIDFVAVTDGPGSFTGLRIGVTTAKALAYALNCKIIAVDALACMAMQLWTANPTASRITTSLNAYRGQQFTATWTREQWTEATDVTGDFASQSGVVDSDHWSMLVEAAPNEHLFGAEAIVANRFTSGRVVAVEPNARDVAMLSFTIGSHERFASPMQLLPRYLRDSAAEEKLRSG